MRKTKAQLEAELDAANKRIADLTDALVKAVQAQPVYVPYAVPLNPAPVNPWPWGTWCDDTAKITWTSAGTFVPAVTLTDSTEWKVQ